MGDDPRPASTVFFGGGTPTMLDPAALVRLLDGVRDTWGLAAGAEVTTEANPDSVTADVARRARGRPDSRRVSFGMQSAVPHVLATLERTHNPDNVARAVGWAREAGLAVSLDLIYGTPGESLEDWRTSLDAGHCARARPRERLLASDRARRRAWAAQLRSGEIAPADPDAQADMYEAADDALAAAGYSWYEVSNWARTPDDACRHNLALLAEPGLVGHRTRRSLVPRPSCRRWGRADPSPAVVERQAPARVLAAARGRRGPRRRDTRTSTTRRSSWSGSCWESDWPRAFLSTNCRKSGVVEWPD